MPGQQLVVGLLADPGLPRIVADDIAEAFRDDLAAELAGPREWVVDVSQRTLPLDAEGDIPLLDSAERLKEEGGWDYIVYLTDLPRDHDGEPMVCELSGTWGAALVSLPVLGPWRLRHRTRRLVVSMVRTLLDNGSSRPTAEADEAIGSRDLAHRDADVESGDISYITRPGRWNSVRLLAGMVQNNRPVRLLGALSRSIAAAAATGAFGIFYTTIWNMADSLSHLRLALISVAAMVAFGGWLIVHNRLWSRRDSTRSARSAALDNAATILTVGTAVVLVYLVLYLVLFVGAMTVITGEYLESQLGHPISIADYLQLTWLAASMGTTAGALGSNFDSDHAIREATYSRREYQRRLLAGQGRDEDGQ